MRRWQLRRAHAALCTGILALTLFPASALRAAPSPCDRQCLKAEVNRYLAALVAHDPSRVPIAANARFVENTEPTAIGQGLWKTASALPSTFMIYVPDPLARQVGFLGVMQEEGKPIELALRLKLERGQIVEIEHLIARNLRPAGLANLRTPRPGLLATVPPAERSSREQLLAIGQSYYQALVTADANDAPFAEDCERHENGMQSTTNKKPAETPISNAQSPSAMATLGTYGCAAQLKTHLFDYIKRIEPRRVWIADVETGLVFGLSQFRHPFKEQSVTIVGVPGIQSVPMKFKPFDMPAAHIFKVRDGKIHEIEAMGITIPYDSKTGWETPQRP